MKQYKQFLIDTLITTIALITVILLMLLIIGKVFVGKNVYTKGAANIHYWITVKNNRAKELDKKGNKIVFLSGSNALHGLDSKYASQKTGLPVLNYGIHAAFDTYMFKMGKDILKSGDIVVLPLEFTYYMRENTSILQSPFAEYIISYMPDYYKKADFVQKMRISIFLVQTFLKQPKLNYDNNKDESEFIVQLNDYGDYVNHKGTTDQFLQNISKTQIAQFIPKDNKNFPLYDFIQYCKENNIKVYAIMPNYYHGKEFSKREIDDFYKIKSFYTKQGVKFIGEVGDGAYDDKYLFYDTGFHTNEKGTRLRTEWIIKNVLSLPEIKNSVIKNKN